MNTLGAISLGCQALSALFMITAPLRPNKQKMLEWQVFDYSFAALACLCVGGISGLIVNGIAAVRLGLSSRINFNRLMIVGFCLLSVIPSLIFNQNGSIGLLPIAASLIYVIPSMVCKSPQSIRIALIANALAWIAYNVMMGLWIMFASTVVLIITSIIGIIRYRKTKKKNDVAKT